MKTLIISPDVTFNYYGNDVILHINDKYIEDNLKNIIKVYSEGKNVTNDTNITIKMSNENNEIVQDIDSSKTGKYIIEYIVEYKNVSKTFIKNVTIIE